MLLILGVCLFLGAVVGFLAGLLGIGGGLIIVPILVVLFQHRQKIQPMNYLLSGNYLHHNQYFIMMAFYHGVNNKPKTYPGLIFCHNTSFLS